MAMLGPHPGPNMASHHLFPGAGLQFGFASLFSATLRFSDGHAYDVGFIDIHILKKQSTTI